MLVQAQAAVNEKYRIYEDLAARDGSRFLPHWEDGLSSLVLTLEGAGYNLQKTGVRDGI